TTHGRISLKNACALAPSFDTAGWFARESDLMRAVAGVLLDGTPAAREPGDILLAQDAFALVGPREQAALRPAVERAADILGGAPRAVSVAAEGLAHWFEIFRVFQFAEIWREHGAWIRRVNPKFGPGIAERLKRASAIGAEELARAAAARAKIATHMHAMLGNASILVLPTVPSIAPRLDTPMAELEDFRARAMALLCVAGLAGLPQISLPLASLDDCPLALSLIGPPGSDEMLLAAAERIMPPGGC
ncbi:MAG: amidase, partial [Proteobacteria bacterium]|nr:amidase [Pseudomonadota bacterium]